MCVLHIYLQMKHRIVSILDVDWQLNKQNGRISNSRFKGFRVVLLVIDVPLSSEIKT